MDTGDLEELAGLINFRVGAWQDFGYEHPPAPDCVPIPPLGQRSASAIKAAHEAIKDIDRLITRLHQVRDHLASELLQDGDIRASAQLPDDEYIRAHGGEDLDAGHLRDPEGDEAAHA